MATAGTLDQDPMAKLQKKPRQSTRHSASTKPIKLTPAEIRAQNNNSQPSTRPSSRAYSEHVRRARQLDHTTPPPSPEKIPISAYEKQTRRSTTPLPTPPHTPVLYYAKTINQQQMPLNFSMPRSHASAQADHLVSSAISSRQSSFSSLRSLPTYRGAQMTRTGSFTLLQHPSQQIVANPLSNFSRPRRSGSASPARSKLIDDTHVCDHDENRYLRNNSMDSISAASEALPDFDRLQPPERNVSPISFEANQSVKDFSIVRDGVVITPSISSSAADDGHIATAKPVTVVQRLRENRHSQSNISKVRRHTMPVSGIPATGGSAYGAQSTNNEGGQPVFSSHPAVRPLTVAIPPTSILKGKERESYSAPVVRCCHKCGRHKKPDLGDENPLSPVLEDPKVIPGLEEEAMMSGGVVLDQQQQQATRSPKRSSGTRTNGVKWEDRRAEGKIRPPPPPTIMRFASLRGYTTDTEGLADEAIANGEDYDSGVGMGESGEGVTNGVGKVGEGPVESSVQVPQGSDLAGAKSTTAATPASSVKSKDEDFVLAREQQFSTNTNSSQPKTPAAEADSLLLPPQKPWQPLADSVSASESESEAEARKKSQGLKLPKPTLTPHFARSNQTLRGLVMPLGASQTDLLGASVSDEKEVVVIARPSTAPGMKEKEKQRVEVEYGDLFRGFEMSRSIDEMRERQALKMAEIMAI